MEFVLIYKSFHTQNTTRLSLIYAWDVAPYNYAAMELSIQSIGYTRRAKLDRESQHACFAEMFLLDQYVEA